MDSSISPVALAQTFGRNRKAHTVRNNGFCILQKWNLPEKDEKRQAHETEAFRDRQNQLLTCRKWKRQVVVKIYISYCYWPRSFVFWI